VPITWTLHGDGVYRSQAPYGRPWDKSHPRKRQAHRRNKVLTWWHWLAYERKPIRKQASGACSITPWFRACECDADRYGQDDVNCGTSTHMPHGSIAGNQWRPAKQAPLGARAQEQRSTVASRTRAHEDRAQRNQHIAGYWKTKMVRLQVRLTAASSFYSANYTRALYSLHFWGYIVMRYQERRCSNRTHQTPL
jgi:hypothetical protein